MKNRKGITLIELVLTVALMGLVIQGLYSVFFVGTNSYSVSTNKGFSQQDIRLASEFIKNELKYISYFKDNQVGFVDNYYSLSIGEIDGKKRLIKTFYEYQDQDTEDPSDDVLLETIQNSFDGVFDSLTIKTYEPTKDILEV